METRNPLVIGYFSIRGKAQVPRLLCQYCNVTYQNKFYSPKQFLEEKKKNPNFKLPFLNQGKTQIYGPEDMCFYILNRSGNTEMLGKSEQDQVKVKMYCWSIDVFASVIGTNSSKRPNKAELEKQWEKNLKLKLKKYEKACAVNGQWFLGYLTLIDFSIYELVRYMDWMFPDKMMAFPNLCSIKSRISGLPQIKSHQISADSVKQMSPENILKQITALLQQKAGKK